MSNEIAWCYKHRFKITKNTIKTKEKRCLECNYVRRYPVEYWLTYEVKKIQDKIDQLHGKPELQEKLKETIKLLKRKHSLGITIDPRQKEKSEAMYILKPTRSRRGT